jgi:hypothetical protein
MNSATARTLPATTDIEAGHRAPRAVWRGLRQWWSRIARPTEPSTRAAGTRASSGGADRPAPAHAAVSLAQRRAEAMCRLFPMLSSWQAAPSYGERLAATYASLAAASDLDDLEWRLRQVEQFRQVEPVGGAGASPGRSVSFC